MPEHQQTHQSTESKTTSQKQATPRIQTPVSHPMAIIQRARINPKSLTPADVLQLQRTIGNRAVGRLLSEIGLIPSKAKQAPPVQRQELVQRQEIPEEEPLQGKFENEPENETCPSCMQRQEIPEEKEPLQGKFETIQRLEPEEEEKLQMKSVMQRQEISEEEDEPVQGKMIGTVQRQEIPEEEPLQPKRENNTGMPDNLKAGVESLSRIDMSDVRVHYNSNKPAEVGALAYTQGTNIHVAPGQERHLPHEAWHVVQQAQGRVKPTMQMKGLAINDDPSLENESDMMGAKTAQFVPAPDEEEPLQGKFGEGRGGNRLATKATLQPICLQTIQREYASAKCNCSDQNAVATAHDDVPKNWVCEAMNEIAHVMPKKVPVGKGVFEEVEGNALFACAEPKSLSRVLNTVSRTKKRGISQEALDSIYWEDVVWLDAGDRTNTAANACPTCQTWIVTQEDGVAFEPKQEAKEEVRQVAERENVWYESEAERDQANQEAEETRRRERDEAIMAKKRRVLREFGLEEQSDEVVADVEANLLTQMELWKDENVQILLDDAFPKTKKGAQEREEALENNSDKYKRILKIWEEWITSR